MPAGRKPTATAQKRLNGNPGKRALNHDEPAPKIFNKLPTPPDWLGEYAVAEWKRAGKILLELGLLADADLMLFAAYCQNVHMLIVASINVKQNGFTIAGARGEVKNPAVSSFQTATTALRSLASEFGMTPASRTRFKSPADDEESFEEIMNEVQGDADDAE
jgi:P27 family predicted phage terminase small subunit